MLSKSCGLDAAPALPRRPAGSAEVSVSPLPTAVTTTLYAGAIFRLIDWRCPGHDHVSDRDEWTDDHEVVVTRRGVYSREVAGARVVADASTVAFWNAGEAYRIRHPVAGGDECSIFQIRPAALREFVASVDPARADAEAIRFPFVQRPLSGRAYLAHRTAVRAASAGAGAHRDHLAVEELGLAFLLSAVADAPLPTLSNRYAREYANRVQAVVAARFRDPLSLSDIGRLIGCSPYHLTRLVRQELGTSIHQLLVRVRLRAALEHLVSTTEDISPIALAVGFASHSHFSQAFRREFGCTPAAARRLVASRDASAARRP